VFGFGNSFWGHQTGTTMGTPPAPMYTTLYFAIHEHRILPLFATELVEYGQYIDNGFGI
jgi:hypothetical protein